jgi:hypothetical protein
LATACGGKAPNKVLTEKQSDNMSFWYIGENIQAEIF